MTNEDVNKTPGVKTGEVEKMDRNEGETFNGTVGGTGSDLDKAAKRLEEEREGDEQKNASKPDGNNS